VGDFTCLVVNDSVLTWENLRRRGIHLCSRCYICVQNLETINHLLLHCKMISLLKHLFTSFRGIRWIMPGRTSDALMSLIEQHDGLIEEKVKWKRIKKNSSLREGRGSGKTMLVQPRRWVQANLFVRYSSLACLICILTNPFVTSTKGYGSKTHLKWIVPTMILPYRRPLEEE